MPSTKAPSFHPVSSGDQRTLNKQTAMMRGLHSLDSKGVFSASLWVWIALTLMLVSNILFFVSFVTNHWGLAKERNGTYWEVGLWQSCRHNSHHDLCIGPGWPAFYSATRSFMVMSLFGHMLLFAWLIGYALEKLLEYDPCTVGCLVALAFSTAIFMIIALCCFLLNWPAWVMSELSFIHSIHIDYSVFVALPCPFLLFTTGILLIIEIRTSLTRLLESGIYIDHHDKQYHQRHSIESVQVIFDDDEDDDDVTYSTEHSVQIHDAAASSTY